MKREFERLDEVIGRCEVLYCVPASEVFSSLFLCAAEVKTGRPEVGDGRYRRKYRWRLCKTVTIL